MPIDLALARTAKPQTSTVSWDEDRVILYHLGLGAGLAKPTDAKELEYTYEGNLKVLPSFAVVPTFGALAAMTGFPGIDVNFALVLHGEQDVEIHRPIPTVAEVENVTRLAGVYDKGKAALIVLEVETRHRGEPLFTNRFSIFARGEGGFGGEGGPKPGNEAPPREPEATFESPTLANQALLYRLSGDKNPLHADPAFAKLGGFDKPILHGLCTFGVVCKAVVDGLLDGDVTKVARYQVRFAGVVYPGETIVTSAWREGDRILVGARTKERGQPVLSNAAITVR
jgi:acyl dehydratase